MADIVTIARPATTNDMRCASYSFVDFLILNGVRISFSCPIDEFSYLVGGVRLLFARLCYNVAWFRENYIAGSRAISVHRMKNGN